MNEVMTFTAHEKLRAVRREIGWRKRVYPNRIESGRMDKKQADYEIAIMQAIEQDYEVASQKERLL